MRFSKVLLLLLIITGPINATLDVDIGSDSALLINGDNGKVLFEKRASQPMYPASCTKVAFALYAIKFHQDLFDKRVVSSQNSLRSMTEAVKSKNNFGTHPSYILETDASHMGLKVGEEMSFYDLLVASMVVSADDASNMLAEVMGNGSIDKCVQDVNDYLASIGCTNTHFTNPHGLHHPDHVTTAHDLALMCREAMKEPLFAKIAKMTSFQRPKTNKQEPVVLQQTNKMLVKGNPFYYPPVVGIKTGYHRRAGYCLAAQAEKDGRTLISVVFRASNGSNRFQDTKKLFEAAFNEPMESRVVLAAGPQPFERSPEGGASPITTTTAEPLTYDCYPSEEPEARCQLVWHEVEMPLKKGAPVGELQLIVDGALQRKVTLYAADDVEQTFLSSLYTRQNLFILLGGGILIFIAFMLKPKRRRY